MRFATGRARSGLRRSIGRELADHPDGETARLLKEFADGVRRRMGYDEPEGEAAPPADALEGRAGADEAETLPSPEEIRAALRPLVRDPSSQALGDRVDRLLSPLLAGRPVSPGGRFRLLSLVADEMKGALREWAHDLDARRPGDRPAEGTYPANWLSVPTVLMGGTTTQASPGKAVLRWLDNLEMLRGEESLYLPVSLHLLTGRTPAQLHELLAGAGRPADDLDERIKAGNAMIAALGKEQDEPGGGVGR